jgi:hypothetical protein
MMGLPPLAYWCTGYRTRTRGGGQWRHRS